MFPIIVVLQILSLFNPITTVQEWLLKYSPFQLLHKIFFCAPLRPDVQPNLSTRWTGQTRLTNNQAATHQSWPVWCSPHAPGFSCEQSAFLISFIAVQFRSFFQSKKTSYENPEKTKKLFNKSAVLSLFFFNFLIIFFHKYKKVKEIKICCNRKLMKDIKIFLKKESKKSNNMIANVTKISQNNEKKTGWVWK